MTEHDDLDDIIEKETLLNAQLHEGRAQAKPIMGKIMGANPQFRPRAKEINQKIREKIDLIASWTAKQIQDRLNELDPEAIEKHLQNKEEQANKRRQDKKDISELPNAKDGNFKVRYAPDPSKFPHFGQGVNYIINRIFADKYNGKVLLRFDDTNPYIVEPQYYDAIKRGLQWIGATWDEEILASSRIEEFYDVTKDAINNNLFYICFCDGDTKRELAESKTDCKHRKHSIKENLEYFEKMIEGKYEMGSAIVRLFGDMNSDNNVMRDPIMLRLVDKQHPMLDKMYYVFPTYDFESAYFEASLEITHVIRSGEFGTMRQELQSYLIEKFGGKVPEFVSFGRINIQGCPTQGRVIRQLVDDGIVEGWDDIRLITLQGIEKRGLHPDTVRIIAQEVGFSPSNTQVAWTTIESKSRQLLEPEAKRIFFVENPVRLDIKGHSREEVTYNYHPDHPEWGKRSLKITDTFYISLSDAMKYNSGDIFRLKDLFNVKVISSSDDVIKAEFAGTDILQDIDKIHWVPSENIPGSLLVPLTLEDNEGNIRKNSIYTISGLFENNVVEILENEVVQLERVGFAKVKHENGSVSGHFVHKY